MCKRLIISRYKLKKRTLRNVKSSFNILYYCIPKETQITILKA